MTNEELQAHLRAINDAIANGEVEHMEANQFDKGMSWQPRKYSVPGTFRIKSKPREVWIAEHDWSGCVEADDRVGHAYLIPGKNGRYTKFREVTE